VSLKLEGIEKTYIGAMPGRILQSLKKRTSNPVFVLDEIDKLSVSSQGDPSSALLKYWILSKTILFDNFLEMGYDLSYVYCHINTMSSIQPETVWRS
jgi:ATP-dependent Lon protease